ncbi:PREDICTED: LOW QUALITY PROTEIN: putative cancer susceptibility gene HEPN1 protein [Mandrillus leucophaeus]|uniref:LOW QUALITY PROTEIN: putative cancer susceptibility gene HEPN1 protein n=1 Tax=Mandrillus leucophaeus TaxID=9568 RepID=UPI0005F3D32D|nr:PREDICTED: LOW QUALITY PROTEIN: putative cancer susceptibility gene HEPN1 protein [Mandrillus leucophaeus]
MNEWVVGNGGLGIAPWDEGESELEFRRLNGPGMQGPLEALRRRGWNTQRASFSFRFVIALSPDIVDYCHSYELFNRWWHGHVLATQRPSLFILMLV